MLTITEIRLSDGSPLKLQVTWDSEAEEVYYLERSTNLVLWEEVGTDISSGGESTTTEISVEDQNLEKFFYRVGQR